MSLLTMASPYVSEDNVHRKDGKRVSTLRSKKKVYPQSELSLMNQESSPDYSGYNEKLTNMDNYSSYNTNISDAYFPTLNTVSDQKPDFSEEKMEETPKDNVVKTFYKNTSEQQTKLSSALNKLFGGSGQEGMSDFNSDINKTEPSLTSTDISNPLQKDFVRNTGLITSSKSFSENKPHNGGIPTTPLDPMPMEYLRNSSMYMKPYTDYESGYSNSVIPSHLSNYSYPGTTSTPMPKNEEQSQDNNILLEKISYMIYLLEEQKQQKKKNTTEEFVLYSFLGVFMIYIVDSFSRSGRYIR